MKKGIILSALLALVLASPALAATDTPLVKPNTFSGGTPALAAEVNENFDTVYDRVNEIQSDNLVPAIWQCTVPESITLPINTDLVCPKDLGSPVVHINSAENHLTYNADGSFSILKAGYYLIEFLSLIMAQTNPNYAEFDITINGSLIPSIPRMYITGGYVNVYNLCSLPRTIECDAGDEVKCVMRTPFNSFRLNADTYFQIRYLGPLPTP